jgi:hypothetical protein
VAVLDQECVQHESGVGGENPFLSEFEWPREIASKVDKQAMGLMDQRRCFHQVE